MRLYGSSTPDKLGAVISKTFRIKLCYANEAKSWSDEYLMHHRLAPSSGDPDLDEWAKERKLYPWVSIAAPIKRLDPAFEGLLFSTLSLHIRTQQPVHIHGLFAIAPDRARLSLDDSAVSWNKFMFRSCVAPGWTDLLEHLNLEETNEQAFALWPRTDLTPKQEDLWTELDQLMLNIIVRDQRAVWESLIGECLTFGDALFIVNASESTNYCEAWKVAETPGVVLKQTLFNKLSIQARICGLTVRCLTPQSFRQYLSHRTSGPPLSAPRILEYSLLDAMKDDGTGPRLKDVRKELGTTPIWPMLNGALEPFKGEGKTLMPHDQVEMDFFRCSRASITLNLSCLTQEVCEFLLKDANSKSVFARLRTLKDLATDWPTIFKLTNASIEPYDVRLRDLAQDLQIKGIWKWIYDRSDSHCIGHANSLENLWLLPLQQTRIRRLKPQGHSNPTLILAEGDAFKRLIVEAAPGILPTLINIIDSHAIGNNAIKLLKQVALDFPALRLATEKTLEPLIAWLVSSKDLLRSMSDYHRQRLLAHVASLVLSVDAKKVFPLIKDQIKSLPIFSKCTSQVSCEKWQITKACIDLTRSVSFALPPGLPPLPEIPGVSLYDMSDDSERLIVSKLSLIKLDAIETLLDGFLLPWVFKEQTIESKKARSDLINWLFNMVQTDRNPTWKRIITNRSLVPVIQGNGIQQHARPMTLVDPISTFSRLFFDDEGVFPDKRFFGTHAEALRLCGMRPEIYDGPFLLNRALSYSKRTANEELVEKVRLLLLSEVSRGLDEINVQDLRGLKWIPADSPNGQVELYAPSSCRGIGHDHLVDKVWGTTNLLPNPFWKQLLGWNDDIPHQVLLQQLDLCVQQRDHARVNILLTHIAPRHFSLLSSKKCILGSHGQYLIPKAVSTPGKSLIGMSLEPWLDRVDPLFVHTHGRLLSALGVQSEPCIQDLQGVQKSLQDSCPSSLDDSDLSLCIAVLEVARNIGCGSADLLIPDTTGILREKNDVVHNEGFLTEKFNDFHFTHPRISSDLINGLQIESCWERALRLQIEFDEGDADEFTPKEDLKNTIYDTLSRYPVVTAFNEFLANADDAGAEHISWTVDERYHSFSPSASTLDKELSMLNGPALTVYNDSVFDEKDFEGLKHIGEGGKADDANTTGMFGRGVMCAYHFCDVAMLLSGDSFVILDPRERHLPRSRSKGNRRKAGIKIPIATARRLAAQQLSLFEGIYGYSQETDYFNGTIWRFAFRGAGMETPLTGTLEVMDVKKASKLVDSYFESARNSLLFLPSIKTIKAYHQADRTPKCTWTVSTSRVAGSDAEVFQNVTTTVVKHGQKPVYDLWRIGLHDIESSPADVPKVGKGATKITECGIAACLQFDQHSNPGFNGKFLGNHTVRHHVFCRLPVDLSVELPVSIHASFAITGDRKTMSISDDDEVAKWNCWLLKDCLATFYIDFLKDLAARYGSDAFKFWPAKPLTLTAAPKRTISNVVSTSFWAEVLTPRYRSEPLYPLNEDGLSEDQSKTNLKRAIPRARRRLLNVVNSENAHFYPSPLPVLQPLFHKLGLNLVTPPFLLWRDIKSSAADFSIAEIGPKFLSQLFQDEMKVKVLEDYLQSLHTESDRERFYASFLEVIVPLTSQKNVKDLAILEKCRILPRPTLTLPLGKLSFENADCPHLMATETEQKLFSFAADCFVHTQLFKSKQELKALSSTGHRDPIADICLADVNIRGIEAQDLCLLLMRPGSPTRSAGSSKIYFQWLIELWSYLNSRFDMTNAVEFMQEARLLDQPIYRITPSAQDQYISPRTFENGAYIVSPLDEQERQMCSNIPSTAMVDRSCLPSSLVANEGAMDTVPGYRRFIRALSRAYSSPHDLSTFLNAAMTPASRDTLRLLLDKYIKSITDTDPTKIRQRIILALPIWPREIALQNNLSYHSASGATFCEHKPMFVPWMKKKDDLVKSSVVRRHKVVLCKLGVPLLSVQDFWARIKDDMPLRIETPNDMKLFQSLLTTLSINSIKTNARIAVRVDGCLLQAKALYDHQDEMFANAFQNERNTHFLHEDLRDLRSFFIQNGLRSREGNRTIHHSHFIDSAQAVDRQWRSDLDVATYVRTAGSITSYLNFEKPEFLDWPSTIWKTLETLRIFKVRDSSSIEPSYRLQRMKSLAEEATFCALKDTVKAEYTRVCWSRAKFVTSPPAPQVYNRMSNHGRPSLEKVYQHLHYLVTLHDSVLQSEVSEYLQDLQACYKWLQDDDNAKNLPGIRSAKIWFNLDSTVISQIQRSQLAPSLLPTHVLCLQAPCDTPTMIRTKKFLAPYDGLLITLGCPSFSQPPPPPPRPIEANERSIWGSLNELRKSKMLVDVYMEVEGTQIAAHKVVLAAASDFCKAHFATHWGKHTPDRCVVPLKFGLQKLSTLSTMIEWAYGTDFLAPVLKSSEDTDEIADRLDEILDVLECSNAWQMLRLRDQVEDFLTETTNATIYRRADNVDHIRKIAEEAKATRLVEDCDRYIQKNKDGMERMRKA
ncbi:uncharacterized protein KY384_006886 [Bacidia gigantensis]|uniref:uncharacterized protein n=1 Tax=Bacidia gigantensis TaxID=2732470 RepID=UPI001D0438BB|nr:uncharacterized protein KY384_006886 [Bacidia gigantensis]KAG8527970.1 hypothetical protein KY384_006886 [Bacidia gigantensis]